MDGSRQFEISGAILGEETRQSASEIFNEQLDRNYRRTDRLFAYLLVIQWVGGILLSLIVSPRVWAGTISQPHLHVYASVFLGGAIIALPVYLALRHPGLALTRHVIAAGQLLLSVLLIHITGGRLETHFHVFGSLAFLAFYRDWRVLITASTIVAIDHLVRGLYWPQSVYGVLEVQPWRWLEHTAWVAFEDAFLIVAIRQSVGEMYRIASQQAELAIAHRQLIERSVRLEENEELLSGKLDEALKDLIRARDGALEASRLKSEFLANMSHEIRTPMNAVIGMTDILFRNAKDQKEKERLSVIRDAGQGLLAIIGDILDFSKIEAGKMIIERAELDILSAVEGVSEILSSQARAKGIALITYVDPDIPRILLGDSGRLRQILVNLIGNAIKFTEIGHVIVKVSLVAVTDARATVKFVVEDSGIGLSESETERLFTPFVQADASTTRKFSGTGLGLSICKRLVTLMGGDIGVTSEKGKGSTFYFSLPFEFEPASTHKDTLVQRELNGKRVLIVDDDASCAEVIRLYLEKWNVESSCLASGAEVVPFLKGEASRGNVFDIGIVDLFMPGKDALELYKEIQEEPELKGINLILVTAFDKHGQEARALHTGFKAYLRKPVRQGELFHALVSVSGKAEADAAWSAPAAVPQSPGTEGGSEDGGLILVVEDHPANQIVAQIQLAELGFSVHIANNGVEALNAMSQHEYQLVLMDCMMPVMDGFQATSEIRKREASTSRRVPIIAMTARVMADDKERCMAAGMDDYLSKPVEMEQLRRLIHKWMPGRVPVEDQDDKPTAPQPTEAVLADDLVIDLEGLLAMFGDDGVDALWRIHSKESCRSLQLINESIEGNEPSRLAFVSHKLKGACASLRCGQMRALCLELEQLANQNDWATARAKATDLQAAYDRVKAVMDRYGESPKH